MVNFTARTPASENGDAQAHHNQGSACLAHNLGGIDILLVNIHAMTRAGLRRIIESEPGYRVGAEASSRREVLSALSARRPQLVVLDLNLGAESVLGTLDDLREADENIPVLGLIGIGDPELYSQMIQRGARGLVRKTDKAESLLKAIDRVHAREMWLDRSLTASIIAKVARSGRSVPRSTEQARLASLSRREHAVIELIAAGHSNKVIAKRLAISDSTVRHHLTSIFAKLHLKSRVELVIFALQHRPHSRVP